MEVHSLEVTEPTEAVEGVELAQLGGGDRLNVQHFSIHPGASVPKHAHPEHEQLSFCYAGSLTFLVDGEAVSVAAGDAAVLPQGESHAVENRGETVARGIDVYSPPRPTPDWLSE